VDYESDGSCQRSACGFYHHHPIGDIVTHLPLSRIASTSLGPAGPALKNHALYEATRPTKDWTDRIKRARAALERRGEQRGKRKQSGWDVAREPRQQRSGQNAQSLKQSNWDTKRDLRHQRSGQNAQSHMPPSSSSSSSRAYADAGASKNYNTSERSGIRPGADGGWGGNLSGRGFSIEGCQALRNAADDEIVSLKFDAQQAAARKEYFEKQRVDLLAFQEARKKMGNPRIRIISYVRTSRHAA